MGKGRAIIMSNIYFVTDESTPLDILLETARKAGEGGVAMVQLREKNSTGKDFYEKAKALKVVLDQYQIPLIINDRIDIALAVGASGVHIGQKDLPLSVVKEVLPSSMIVGISVSTVEQAKEAEENGANYIGVGAVFPTKTKKDARLLPEGMLSSIIESVNLPVYAIGGIHPDNVQTLKGKGLAGVAVVSAIMHAKQPEQVPTLLKNKMQMN